MSVSTPQQSKFLTDNWHGPVSPARQQITMGELDSHSSSHDTDRTFIVDQRVSRRFVSLLKQVCNLCLLEPDWDSYGARAIDPRIIECALNVLLNILEEDDPFPSVVPTVHGGIQLEWHVGGIDMEIEFRSPSSIDVWLADGEYEEEQSNAKIGFIRRKIELLRIRLK